MAAPAFVAFFNALRDHIDVVLPRSGIVSLTLEACTVCILARTPSTRASTTAAFATCLHPSDEPTHPSLGMGTSRLPSRSPTERMAVPAISDWTSAAHIAASQHPQQSEYGEHPRPHAANHASNPCNTRTGFARSSHPGPVLKITLACRARSGLVTALLSAKAPP